MPTSRDPICAGYGHPVAIISYVVWLYFRFPLSLRMVEEMLAARGLSITYETIRQWGLKFGSPAKFVLGYSCFRLRTLRERVVAAIESRPCPNAPCR